MASSGVKLILLLALVATSCMAQSPTGAPTVSPTAAPVSPPTATPSPSPAPSSASPTPGPVANPTPSPTAGEPSPASGPGAATPTSNGPAAGPGANQSPADGSNDGFMSRAAIGGTAFTAVLVAVALMDPHRRLASPWLVGYLGDEGAVGDMMRCEKKPFLDPGLCVGVERSIGIESWLDKGRNFGLEEKS
ncbi:hypothetical protein BUALT_Bualt11G0022100 [Buddleja alternifolia]|uniref:Uncharacterized protein n=1 Tax=Buddleja alternifolia TaxID=168488 RepID=A0AAV6WYX8_9LAMI|nr:hypothetical protein BUALT_Bualt11G0022100 [Buddleja alternifolia]